MKNLKMELFNFKQKLLFEQADVANIIEGFLYNYDEFSEKELQKLSTESKEDKFEVENTEDKKTKQKYWVN